MTERERIATVVHQALAAAKRAHASPKLTALYVADALIEAGLIAEEAQS